MQLLLSTKIVPKNVFIMIIDLYAKLKLRSWLLNASMSVIYVNYYLRYMRRIGPTTENYQNKGIKFRNF